MSRTRLEKEPNRVCGFAWSDPNGGSSLDCPHICRLPVSQHGGSHICCGELGGVLPVTSPL